MNEDQTKARALVVKYHADRDERLIKLFSQVINHLHSEFTTPALALELEVIKEMSDSYENLGRFNEAGIVRLTRDVIAHELALRQADDNEELMNRSEMGAFAKGLKF